MANAWLTPHQQGYVRYPMHLDHRGSRVYPRALLKLRSPDPIHTRWYHFGQSAATRLGKTRMLLSRIAQGPDAPTIKQTVVLLV